MAERLVVQAVSMHDVVNHGIGFALPLVPGKSGDGEGADRLGDGSLCLFGAPVQLVQPALVFQVYLGLGGEHLSRGEGFAWYWPVLRIEGRTSLVTQRLISFALGSLDERMRE